LPIYSGYSKPSTATCSQQLFILCRSLSLRGKQQLLVLFRSLSLKGKHQIIELERKASDH